MTALASIHTFLRRQLQQIPWDGPRFGSLIGYLGGLLPDSLAEAHRAAARMLVPLPETSRDVLPYLLRDFGLPAYQAHDTSGSVGYLATLARMGAAAWETHAIAGSCTGLAAELTGAGLEAVRVNYAWSDSTISEFRVETTSAVHTGAYGDGGTEDVYGPDGAWGAWHCRTAAQRQGLRAVLAYFRPARSRFVGLVPPTLAPLGPDLILPFVLGEPLP